MSSPGPARDRPILVTGAHRSGSTWVGRMIAASGAAHYIHEPFNPKAFDPEVCKIRFEREFTYVCRENAADYRDGLERCLQLAPRPPWEEGSLLSRLSVHARLRRLARLARMRLLPPRPLLKDPHAVFAAEWLADTFGMDVVILVRHPAAFVGSLKKANWTFRFEQFLEQPLLMTHHLDGLRSEIEHAARGSSDLIDQGILLWNAIYGAVAGYRERRPQWIVCRHEDLSRDPEPAFGELFDRLGLRYTRRARRAVALHSGSHNPVEQHAGDPLKRHSQANVHSWQRRLCGEEIERVRKGTEVLAARFYAEEDWSPRGTERT